MHVVVTKRDFLRIVARCQGVADKKSTMPALGNLLLRTDAADKLRTSATDLHLSVTGAVTARIERPGSIALGARDLLERVRMMPEGELSIETAPGSANTTVRALGSARRYTLHGIPGEEFPTLPEPDANAPLFELEVASFARLIAATHFSISTDETRLHLNSALLEWEGEAVRMVTTDGHRLSKMEVLQHGRAAQASILVPLKGILELRRLCDEARSEEGDSRLQIVQSGPNAFFSISGFRFSVKLVDAQFPPYQQVIPEKSERIVRAPRLAVADALKAVAVAASDRTGGVKLTVADNKLRFESESPESGEGFDEVEVSYEGREMTVGFNARYFLDVLGSIEADEITLGLSGELDPAVVRPASEGPGSAQVAVIMPMRI